MHKTVTYAIVSGINGALALITIFSAFGGTINPETAPVAALAGMFLSGILLADMLVLVLDLIFWRKACIAILAALIVSIKPLLVFAPVNLPPSFIPDHNTFTLLTYNCLHFEDFQGDNPDAIQNATIDFILEADADIVNLQELDHEDLEGGHATENHITQEQLKLLNETYPYHFYDQADHLSFLSKYPATVEKYPFQVDSMPNVAIFRLTFSQHELMFYNVHLRSILLTPHDKSLYKNLVHPHERELDSLKQEVIKVKSSLVDKLTAAFQARSREAQYVRDCLNMLHGPSILAGDFNDIPGCYAARVISNGDMTDAYAHAGFGPVITYHADHFYFRIDQIFFRGPLRCLEMKRLRVPFSDHYPMLATFQWL